MLHTLFMTSAGMLDRFLLNDIASPVVFLYSLLLSFFPLAYHHNISIGLSFGEHRGKYSNRNRGCFATKSWISWLLSVVWALCLSKKTTISPLVQDKMSNNNSITFCAFNSFLVM